MTPVFRQLIKSQKVECPPYAFVFYPVFRKLNSVEQLKTVIHEMKHISRTKKRVVDHLGFGDEGTDQLLRKLKYEEMAK